MGYINKKKIIGLIANEYSGIENCKVDDIISFIENIPDELSDSWISIAEKLPTESEYLTFYKDGSSSFKRLNIAFKTDTIEYAIGYYDGYKWFTDRHKIKNVIAWKPFMIYEENK